MLHQVHIKGTSLGKPISSNDTESKTSREIPESRMVEPKIADIVIKHLNKSKWTTQSKLRMGEPNSTEEVKGGKNKNYKMGKPSSSEEAKSGETTKRSLGKPSSHKEKNILDDTNTLNKTNILECQLGTGKPNSTEQVKGREK